MKVLKKFALSGILFAVIGVNLLVLVPKETKAKESTLCVQWPDICYLMDVRFTYFRGN